MTTRTFLVDISDTEYIEFQYEKRGNIIYARSNYAKSILMLHYPEATVRVRKPITTTEHVK